MPDLFLTYAYADESFATGLADTLAGRGLTLGDPVSLWPGMRLLPRVDQGLVDSRRGLVVVSTDFLKFSWPRKELDGLANRSRVLAILHELTEEDVRDFSARLATAAIPGCMAERLVRLVRPGPDRS